MAFFSIDLLFVEKWRTSCGNPQVFFILRGYGKWLYETGPCLVMRSIKCELLSSMDPGKQFRAAIHLSCDTVFYN